MRIRIMIIILMLLQAEPVTSFHDVLVSVCAPAVICLASGQLGLTGSVHMLLTWIIKGGYVTQGSL